MSKSNTIVAEPAGRMGRLTTPSALRLELVALVVLVLLLGRLIPSFGDLLHAVAKSLLP
jgi:hypothetical protein